MIHARSRLGAARLAPCLPPHFMPYPTPAPSVVAANDLDTNGDELIQAPENHGEYPLFGNLCALLDRLQRERKQDNRRAILSKWFEV